MAIPTEHKTVQARILDYAQEIGWTFVPRAEAEARRGFDMTQTKPAERAKPSPARFVKLLSSCRPGARVKEPCATCAIG